MRGLRINMYNPYNDLDLLPEGQEVQVMDLSDCEGESDPLPLAQGEMSSDPASRLYVPSNYEMFLKGGWLFYGLFQCLNGPDVHAVYSYVMWTPREDDVWPAKTGRGEDCQS